MNAATKIEPPRNVYQKLNEARIRFHSTELRKSGKNTFAGYSYFELGDFLVPALKIFNEVGLSAHISFSADTATMTIVNVDDIGDRIHIESPMGSAALKGCHEVQNIGAVETYQRRYLWVTALEIVEHDALDSGEPAGEQSQRGKVSPRQDTPDDDNGKYKFPEGPATGITQMKAMARELYRAVNACESKAELDGLTLPEHNAENAALLRQMAALENPAHRQIWEGDGKDNPGLYGLIIRKENQFARQIADYATV